jgi:hypothetical protein
MPLVFRHRWFAQAFFLIRLGVDLNWQYTEGDPVGDAAMQALMECSPATVAGGPPTIKAALATAWDSHRQSPSTSDSRVAALFDSAGHEPAWLDRELLAHGQVVFFKHSQAASLALLYYSLVGGFSAPKITAVLDATGYLTERDAVTTWRRLNETFEMVLECIEHDSAMEVGREGWLAVLKVRLIHSRVRLRLKPRWDAATRGVPINQEDLMGVLCAFSVNVLKVIHQIGAPFLTAHDELAYLHWWRYMGYLIGIRDEYNPCESSPMAHGRVESIVLHLLRPDERAGVVARHLLKCAAECAPLGWRCVVSYVYVVLHFCMDVYL